MNKKAIAWVVLLGFCGACELIKVEGPKKETVTIVSPSVAPSQFATESPVSSSPATQPTPFGQVTRDEFGKDWPLTVERGVLRCNQEPNGMQSVVFLANGEIYAVNGTAMATKKFKKIDLIWADHPVFPKTKKNISPLLERGLSLCGK